MIRCNAGPSSKAPSKFSQQRLPATRTLYTNMSGVVKLPIARLWRPVCYRSFLGRFRWMELDYTPWIRPGLLSNHDPGLSQNQASCDRPAWSILTFDMENITFSTPSQFTGYPPPWKYSNKTSNFCPLPGKIQTKPRLLSPSLETFKQNLDF